MPYEIERRFLVTDDSWRKLAERSVTIMQGYFTKAPDYCVRIRIMDEKDAFLTIKSNKKRTPARAEFEYPVPLAHAREMLMVFCVPRVLMKRRHYITAADGHQWEVDEFLGRHKGLVIAEVELKAPDEAVAFPDWIDSEITDDPNYSNQRLAAMPPPVPDKPAEEK